MSNLPLDIVFLVEGREVAANSLLFKEASPYFADSIQNQQGKGKIVLSGISLDTFKIVEEFLETGNVFDLWKRNQKELKELRKRITPLKMEGLENFCESVLKRYIDRDNALEALIEAQKEGWGKLRETCFEYLNERCCGIFFHPSETAVLVVEFLDFNERSLAIFDAVKPFIGELIGRKNIPESVEFKKCLSRCPQLIQLNISRSLQFSEGIFEAPSNLRELDISSCNFLDAPILERILKHFQGLKSLNLSDNSQLHYNALLHLASVKGLSALNISKNPQIGDEEFQLIIQSVPHVIDLDCSDCKNIGDSGFFELGRGLKHLIFLNLSHTEISDGILIELGGKELFLEEVDLTRCDKLTDLGIAMFVSQARALKKLTIQPKEELIKKIREVKPHLDLCIE